MSQPLMVAAEYSRAQPRIDEFERLDDVLDTTEYLYVTTDTGGRVSMATVSLRDTSPLETVQDVSQLLRQSSDTEIKVSTYEYAFAPPEKDLQDFPPALASFNRLGRVVPVGERVNVDITVLLHRDTGDRSLAVDAQGKLLTPQMERLRRIGRKMIDMSRVEDNVSDTFTSSGFKHDDANTDTISPLTIITDDNGRPFYSQKRAGFGSAFKMSFDDALDQTPLQGVPHVESVVRGDVTRFGELELSYDNHSAIPNRARQNATSHLLGQFDTDLITDTIGQDETPRLGVAAFSDGSFISFRPTDRFKFYYG